MSGDINFWGSPIKSILLITYFFQKKTLQLQQNDSQQDFHKQIQIKNDIETQF